MPRGTPDYQNLETQTVRVEQGAVNANAFDMGFSRLDGGGRVIWFDDFRAGLGRTLFETDNGGLNPFLDFSQGALFGFTPCANLSPVGDAGISGFYKRFTSLLSGKIGIELSLYMPSNHARLNAKVSAAYSDGNGAGFELQIDASTNIVKIAHTGGQATVFTPSVASYMESRHLALKLTGNPDTAQYDALYVGGNKIDLSAYYDVGLWGYQAGTVQFEIYTFGASAVLKEPVRVDYVIVTSDEP